MKGRVALKTFLQEIQPQNENKWISQAKLQQRFDITWLWRLKTSLKTVTHYYKYD